MSIRWMLGVLGVATLLVLVGCGQKLNVKPQLNPHPKSHLIVEGYIAPSLRHTIKLKWGITYIAHSPKCLMRTKGLKINMPLPHTFYYHPVVSRSGHFKLSIPLDLLIPGKCQWRFYALYYPILVFDQHGRQVREVLNNANDFGLNDEGSKQLKQFNQVWLCNDKNCKTKSWQNITWLIPNQNYYLKLVFKGSTKELR